MLHYRTALPHALRQSKRKGECKVIGRKKETEKEEKCYREKREKEKELKEWYSRKNVALY